MVLDLLHDGLTELDADGRAQPAAGGLVDPGRAAPDVALRPRPGGHLLERPPGHRRRRRGLARARIAGGRRLARGPPAGGRSSASAPTSTAPRRTSPGCGRVDATTVEVALDVAAGVAPRAPRRTGLRRDRRARPHRRPTVATRRASTSPGLARRRRRRGRAACRWSAGRAALAHLDGVELRAVRGPGGGLRRVRGRRRRLGPRARRPVRRPRWTSYGADAFAPFQAELFLGLRSDGPALAEPELRRGHRGGHRSAGRSCGRCTRTSPTRWTRWCPPGSPDRRTEPCTACGHDPAGPAGSWRKPSRTAVPQVAIDYEPRRPRRPMAAIVAEQPRVGRHPDGGPARCRSRTTSASSSRAASSCSRFGWIGGYRIAGRLPRPAVPVGLARQPRRPALAEVDASLAEARASADPAAAGRAVGRGRARRARRRRRRPDRAVPHPGGRGRPRAAPRPRRRRHRGLAAVRLASTYGLERGRLLVPSGSAATSEWRNWQTR